jgi:hypothetical protein
MKANDILNLNLDKDFDLTSVNFDSYQGLLGNTLISIGSDAMLSFNYMSVIKRCVENSLHYFDKNLDIQSKNTKDFIKLSAIDMISGNFRMDSYFGNVLSKANVDNKINVFSRGLLINQANYSQVVSEANTSIQMQNDVNMVLADIRFSTLNFLSMLLETMKTINPSDEDYVLLLVFLSTICKDVGKFNPNELEQYKNTLASLFKSMFTDDVMFTGFKKNWMGNLMLLAKSQKEVSGQVSTLEMLDLIDTNSLMDFCYLLRLSLLDPRSTSSQELPKYVNEVLAQAGSGVSATIQRMVTSPLRGDEFKLLENEKVFFANVWNRFENFLREEILETYDSIKQNAIFEFQRNLEVKPTLFLGFLEIANQNVVNGDKDIPFFKNKTYICMFSPAYNRVWNSVSSSVFGQVSDALNKNNLEDANQKMAIISKDIEKNTNTLIHEIGASNNIQYVIDQQLLAFQKMQMVFDSVCELPIIGERYKNGTPDLFFQDMLYLTSSDNLLIKGLVVASGIDSKMQIVKNMFTKDSSKTFDLLVNQYETISSNVQKIKSIFSNSKNLKQIKDVSVLKASLLNQYVLQNKIYFILQKLSAYALMIDNTKLVLPQYRRTLGAIPPAILATIAASTTASLIYAMSTQLIYLIVVLYGLNIVHRYCMTVIDGGGNLASGIQQQRKDEYERKYIAALSLPDTDPKKKELIKLYQDQFQKADAEAKYALRKEVDKVAITDVPGLLGSSLVKVAVAGLAVGIGIKLFFMYKKEKLGLEAQKTIQ